MLKVVLSYTFIPRSYERSFQAGNGKLDFDVNVNVAEGANNKYTLVEVNAHKAPQHPPL